MKTRTTLRPLAIAAALSVMAGMAHADITVISFGGTNQKAQMKAFYEPYTKATGSKIISTVTRLVIQKSGPRW